jgi:bifunctional non-homologous end joining protein LigD
VQFYAFHILVSDGGSPESAAVDAKASLARLWHAEWGIFLSDFEQGEIGPDLFRRACLMGLEGHVETSRKHHRGSRSDR